VAWFEKTFETVPPFFLMGWDVVCQNFRIGGLWTQEEKSLHIHINCLELKAITLAVQSFLKDCLDLEILDNRNDPLHVSLSLSDFEDFDSGVGQLKLLDL
jgi:hypothetical protein